MGVESILSGASDHGTNRQTHARRLGPWFEDGKRPLAEVAGPQESENSPELRVNLEGGLALFSFAAAFERCNRLSANCVRALNPARPPQEGAAIGCTSHFPAQGLRTALFSVLPFAEFPVRSRREFSKKLVRIQSGANAQEG